MAGVSPRFVRAVSDTVPAPIVGAYTTTGVGRPGISCSVRRSLSSRASLPCHTQSTGIVPVALVMRDSPRHGRVTGAVSTAVPELVVRR